MCLPCMPFNFAKCLFDVLNRLRDALALIPPLLPSYTVLYSSKSILKYSKVGHLAKFAARFSSRGSRQLRKLQVKHKFHIFTYFT